MQLGQWKRSIAYQSLCTFIRDAHTALLDQKRSSFETVTNSKVVLAEKFLLQIRDWVKEIKPIQQPMRFGNKSFRVWLAKVKGACTAFHEELVGPELTALGAAREIQTYFLDSFGNEQRIDYGTGHELTFAAWMTCLYKVGVFHKEDLGEVIFHVFTAYLEVTRALQTTYWLVSTVL